MAKTKSFVKNSVKKTKTSKKGKKSSGPQSFEASAITAHYYGFAHIGTPALTKDDFQKTKGMLGVDLTKKDTKDAYDALAVHPEEKVAILRTYLEKNMDTWAQPVMLYYEGAILPEGVKRKPTAQKIFHLDILGAGKSIAEAIILKTTLETLKDEGYKNLVVHINSVGDRDSMARFCREIANYYRKNIDMLSPHCRQSLKKDPFDVFECKDEKCQAIKENAPSPISYLSEPSRQHFKEVLEYLETLGIDYRINNNLVCNKKIWSQTVFEIREEIVAESGAITSTVLAVGCRYNSVAKKIGFKKEMSAVGVNVSYKKLKKEGAKKVFREKEPKVYFIQLGFDAKLKSLHVIEMLRQAKVPLAQSLGRDKLVGQMQSAENSKIPFTIIMGQKEANENTVIVREMVNRSQDVVSFLELPIYLKKFK